MEIHLTTDPFLYEACAHLMSGSEPWITLTRNYQHCLRAVQGEDKELYVVMDESEGLLGFAVLQMWGTFRGYIQTVCVHPEHRRRGIGTKLLQFCEERIFQLSPNVFMCVSSFNPDAARLYARLGYEEVGELTDFIVAGHAEILLRKTIGPFVGFQGR